MSEEIDVSLRPSDYKPLPDLDEWQRRAAEREQRRIDEALASRVLCSTDGCLEIATTWVFKLDRPHGQPLDGSAEYVACWKHQRSSGPCMVNSVGFLPDGRTWTEGFVKLGEPE